MTKRSKAYEDCVRACKLAKTLEQKKRARPMIMPFKGDLIASLETCLVYEHVRSMRRENQK